MEEGEPTYIYPEHVVSTYILFKNRKGKTNESDWGIHITPREAEQIVPILAREQSVKLNRLSYRNTPLGGTSPEIWKFFTFLSDMNYSLFRHESETLILEEGVKYAEEVIGNLWSQNPVAVNKLEEALKEASKSWMTRNHAA